MRWFSTHAAFAASLALTTSVLFAQQPAPSTPAPSAAQIKQELDRIKKGPTIALFPAEGSDDSGGQTLFRVENTSPFNLVVLVVGPTSDRIELGPYRMQTLTVKPGDYEVAVTTVGRDVPPFYGKQKITANMLFRHKLSIPGV